MNRIYLIILSLLPLMVWAIPTDSIMNVQDAFIAIPQSRLSILPESVRRDMVDYLSVDSMPTLRNVYMGECRVTKSAPDFLEVQLTKVTTLQVKQLDRKKGQPIFMTIYTIAGDGMAADSTVEFYDSSMQPLDASKIMKTPDPKKFWDIPKDSPLSLKDLMEMVPFYTIEYSTAPGSNEVKGRFTMTDVMTQEKAKEITPFLRPAPIWQWDGKGMRHDASR